jgi:hypothetical protein
MDPHGQSLGSTIKLATRTAALAVGTALLISGCAAGSQLGAPGSANVMAVAAAEQIESQGFALCTWLSQAIAESDVTLSFMVEATYTLTDPVPSAGIFADPAGTENYQVASDSSSQVSCNVTGYATDPDYGDEISAHTTVSMQATPGTFTAPDPGQGVEYKGRVILGQECPTRPTTTS